MTEILSQNEIDALLSAMQSGTVDLEAMRREEHVKRVRNYDFRRPNKFSKDQLNTIEFIYENYSRLLTTLLSGTLRSRVLAKVASVDQVTYEEFIRSIPNPTILNIFSLDPLGGKGILEMNPIIGFSIIDRIFGGPGLSTIKGRPLTDIERSVIERISEKMLFLFKEAWSSLISIETSLDNIEINPHFTQIVSPLEMVIIITINIEIGETEGLVNVCLPCMMLEPISSQMSTKFWFSGNSPSTAGNTEYMQKVIEKTKLPVSVVLGQTGVSIKEILELQPGDVVKLDQNLDSDALVYFGDQIKYLGKPGLRGNKIAVKLINPYQEGSEANG